MIRALLVVLLCAGCGASPRPAARPDTLALVDVDVVDVERGAVVPHQTVLVADGVITAIGAAATTAVPAGARQPAVRGRYVAPGLADMHVHLPAGRAALVRFLELELAHGVTLIRGAQGTTEQLAERAALAGSALPELILAGIPIRDALAPDAARALVRDQQRQGFDEIKLLGGIDRPAYAALADEARHAGVRFFGHVPPEIGLDAALAARPASIEHLHSFLAALDTGAPLADVVARTRAAGVAVCATLDFYRIPVLGRESRAARDGRGWAIADERTLDDLEPQALAVAGTRYARFGEVTRALAAGGVPLLVGSDAPSPYAVPGFAYRHELRALADAGVAPAVLVRAATRNASTYLGRPRDGRVTAGARADLVVLAQNPLDDAPALARPEGVVLRGRWIDRAALDALLARHRLTTE